MNLKNSNTETAELSETPATSEKLQAKLDAMEKAGASITERMQATVDFIETQERQKSPFHTSWDDADLDDEDLALDNAPDASAHDPHTSAQDPHTSAQHAHTSDPTSAQQAHASAHDAHNSVPQPDPELPPPPKFQFGVGNPLYEIALDFRAHRDKRSILDHLSDTQRAAIIKLLVDYTEDEVSELLAKNPPAGLGIYVSRYSLIRFKKRYEKQQRARTSHAFKAECEQLLEIAQTNDQAFLYASERLLKMRLFQITGDPEASLEAIAKLTSVITSLRKQSLAERKLAAAHSNQTNSAENEETMQPPPTMPASL